MYKAKACLCKHDSTTVLLQLFLSFTEVASHFYDNAQVIPSKLRREGKVIPGPRLKLVSIRVEALLNPFGIKKAMLCHILHRFGETLK